MILPAAVAAMPRLAASCSARARQENRGRSPRPRRTIAAVVVTLFVGLYPRVMVSDPDFGEQPHDRERVVLRTTTLKVMTVVAAILVPVDPPLPGVDVPRLRRNSSPERR